MDDTLGNFPLAFAVRGGLPYLDKMDAVILSLREGGFLKYLARRYVRSEGESGGDAHDSGTIGVQQLVPGFLLMAVGYGLGLVTLAVEVLVARYKKWKVEKKEMKKGK